MAPEPARMSARGRHGDGDTVDALVQLSFLVQRILADSGGPLDLSIIQMRLLGVLRDRQAGMLELGRHLGLDKSSMTGLVDRAERRGLVERSPSPRDGRAVLVSLTPAGRELTEQCGAEVDRRLKQLIDRLAPAQRDELTRLAAALLASPSTSRDGEPGRAAAQ